MHKSVSTPAGHRGVGGDKGNRSSGRARADSGHGHPPGLAFGAARARARPDPPEPRFRGGPVRGARRRQMRLNAPRGQALAGATPPGMPRRRASRSRHGSMQGWGRCARNDYPPAARVSASRNDDDSVPTAGRPEVRAKPPQVIGEVCGLRFQGRAKRSTTLHDDRGATTPAGRRIGRRGLIRAAGLGAVTLAGGALLSACGPIRGGASASARFCCRARCSKSWPETGGHVPYSTARFSGYRTDVPVEPALSLIRVTPV